MNKTLKILFFMAGLVLILLGGVAGFNIYVDPMCYYRCETIDLNRHTQNVYYQSAQIVAANPDAEILIMGSSRGERTPPLWVQKVSGKKSINLSKGGAGLLLKVTLIRTAEELKLPIKKVIWVADYFELAGDVTDVKVRQTPVLKKHLANELGSAGGGLKNYFEGLQRLIDHNSFEASMRQLQHSEEDVFDASGSGSKIDFESCASPEFKGKTSLEMLPKEVDISYNSFAPPLRAPLNDKFVQIFKNEILDLAKKGIQVEILVPPFHPDLMKRLAKAYPTALELHKQWLQIFKELETEKNVQILSYWDGIPGDDAGPSFWDDGAHPTCKSMMMMLKPGL